METELYFKGMVSLSRFYALQSFNILGNFITRLRKQVNQSSAYRILTVDGIFPYFL